MKDPQQYYRNVEQNARSHDPTNHVTQSKSIGYTEKELQSIPEEAIMGMGCGNPTALAKLQEGQTVLDLGCGGGLDVFLAALKVGPKGYVIGIDVTEEMIHRAKTTSRKRDFRNVEFIVSKMENLPLKDNSVDVVISNCVINHALDKIKVFQEALRCLRTGGRILISDLVVQGKFSEDAFRDEIWGTWLSNAVGKQDYLNAIELAGFKDITIVTESSFYLSEADDRLKGKIISISIEALK
ncbi:MAG: methyltransferase domain-containing protein [Planctomycetaceae bacterium]|nr:methyltransferase domain-containing protein [Planctomycetaceae bacterium]